MISQLRRDKMAMGKIKIEGTAEVWLPEIICICGYCNNHDKEYTTMEFNFREQKIIYLCKKCKKMNEIQFGKERIAPLPRVRMGR